MIENTKEFCWPLQYKDPKRLEQFLKILKPVACFDFILLLPQNTFDSRNLSPSANVSRFSVDFIEEARELKIRGEEIIKHLIDPENILASEEKLERILEEIRVEKQEKKDDLKKISETFNLIDIDADPENLNKSENVEINQIAPSGNGFDNDLNSPQTITKTQ